jgi:hypothetical protein
MQIYAYVYAQYVRICCMHACMQMYISPPAAMCTNARARARTHTHIQLAILDIISGLLTHTHMKHTHTHTHTHTQFAIYGHHGGAADVGWRFPQSRF